ncbi:MAG: alpha-L-fucosidase [Armatimonadota bacterium]
MTAQTMLLPYGPVPTPRQIRHHAREFYGFIHFTINTFTDKEWGFGDESPTLFDPTDFDATQIVRAASDAGMAGLILTCKHHDGFCLWPTATTDHCVRNSPFRGGRGDVVREISDACREAGIEFGVYLSPWDRNSALYGTPEYVTEIYRPQLRELLTQYGPLFEVWFDGANGGDGFYGGANEVRKIDPASYYDWGETWQIVRELQPEAVMFSDIGPDVRWIGNEKGIAGDPCWATLDTGSNVPGVADHDQLNRGDRNGATWLIPECDVSIRPGWFWHRSEDRQVRSGRNLVDLYFQSVGRGATFLLNLTPDRRGRVPDTDAAALQVMRSHLDRTFAHDLGAGAAVLPPADPTSERHTAQTIMLTLPQPAQVNLVWLREDLRYGQRVDAWEMDVWQNEAWHAVASAEAIGAQRLIRFAAVTADRFRLRITKSPVEQVALSEIALFFEPFLDESTRANIPAPAISQSVSVVAPDAVTLLLDRGEDPSPVSGLVYTPAIGERIVARYAVAVSTDNETWREIARGEFSNIGNNPLPQTIRFEAGPSNRFVRFHAERFVSGDRVSPEDLAVITEPPL